MLESDVLSRWVGHAVHDPSGARVGDLIQVYVTDPGNEPRWLVVKRGTFDPQLDLVPASAASVGTHGLTITFGAEKIHGSPRVADRHHLTAAEERELLAHYGVRSPT